MGIVIVIVIANVAVIVIVIVVVIVIANVAVCSSPTYDAAHNLEAEVVQLAALLLVQSVYLVEVHSGLLVLADPRKHL